MAEQGSDKQWCVSFTWIVENVSCCWQKMGERICSPAFAVDSMENTKWRLRLYLRGNLKTSDISVFLVREEDCNGPPTIKVVSEFAILALDGSPLTLKTTKNSYGKGNAFGDLYFVKREDVFVIKRSIFLPEDKLTIRCKMCKSGSQITSEIFLARTRIGIERRSFLWVIENFSSLEPYKGITYPIKSAAGDVTLMSLDLPSTGGQSCEEKFRLDFTALDQRIKFSTLKVFLLAASGDAVECFEDEFWFDKPNKACQAVFLTKKKLIAKKQQFLPNDVLSLHCECAFTTGIVLDVVENITYENTVGKSSTLRTNNPDENYLNFEEKLSISSNTLKDNFKSLFTDRILCDTELRTCTEAFPAHKSILSARSPVFKAMFASDMKEKAKEYVDIEDLKDDTLRRMLLYMYTAVVEDLQWESASELYAASDKYEILTLKSKCSSFLKANLSPDNACEVLLLADLHQDDDLKSVVQGYIMKHDKVIINSNDWEHLMQANLKLAADTMRLKFNE